MILELPVTLDTSNQFTCQLGGVKLNFHLKYNSRTSLWTFDLYDFVTGLPYVTGVPLVLGQDFLEPYNYGLGRLICYDTSNTGTEASVLNLGSTVLFVWFSEDEALNG